jgi:diphthine-ammonia ligase
MKLAALFSGGKDSTYAVWLVQQQGHTIDYLATIHSKKDDSYMYHTINIGLTLIQSQTMKMKLVSKESSGEKEKEVHDIEIVLKNLPIEGIVCGAIASEYQQKRVAKVCKKLGLKLLTPLWKVKPDKYMTELIEAGFKSIITGVFADGFDKSWLGREIDSTCLNDLKKLEKKYKINLAGEGGEFETAVLDCPLFDQAIEIKDSKIHWEKNSGFLEIKDVHLVPKKKQIKGYV